MSAHEAAHGSGDRPSPTPRHRSAELADDRPAAADPCDEIAGSRHACAVDGHDRRDDAEGRREDVARSVGPPEPGDAARDRSTRGDASSTRTTERGARPRAHVARSGKASVRRHGATDGRADGGRRRRDEVAPRLTSSVALAVLGAVPQSIIAVDEDGVVVYVNEQGESLLGWSNAELLGRHVHVVVPSGLRADEPVGGSAEDEQTSVRRRDGSSFPAAISLSAADVGSERWVVAVIRDVTDALQFEQQLVAARRDAVAANAAKDEFLSRMSHELRTPLNAVLGFGQLLAMDELTASQGECVTQIVGAGAHLLGLVDEVLDISQLAEGAMRLSLEPVGLGEVVEEVVGMIRPLADDRCVSIRRVVAPHLHVVADRQRIRQVITNLLANAIKYNRRGGTVEITTSMLDPERCRLTVTDRGSGIPSDELALLFRPFERLSTASADVEGTGLGLALAERLVEAMQGTIGVTSELGVGSSFWIELPAASATPPSSTELAPPLAADAGVARPLPTKTVLYVEDNPSNLRLLERVLDRRPEVLLIAAADGRTGLELALRHRPALVLLDIGLPGMSGEDVLRALEADPRTAGTPVLVITADAAPQRPAELLALGARGFVTKPFDVARILRLVDDLGREPAPSEEARRPSPTVTNEAASANPLLRGPLDAAALAELRSVYGAGAGWSAFVREFCADARTRIGGLVVAARAGDASAVAHTAHTLVGSCSMIGAHRLVAVLDAMERAARRGEAPGELQLATLDAEYGAAEIALELTLR